MDLCFHMYIPSETSQVALAVKNLPANIGDIRDTNPVPGLGRSPGVWTGNPLQYSCLENPMDGGAWWAIVHRVTKSESDTVKWLSMHARMKRRRTLRGPGHRSFSVPAGLTHPLFVGNRHQPPWSSLISKGQIQTVANQGREGTRRQGRVSQETQCSVGAGSWCYLSSVTQ